MNSNIQAITQTLAAELSITSKQVDAFISLFDQGNTVPFIARYRKEATAGLNDSQLRLLETRLIYLRELSTRRSTIIKKLTDQQNLSAELRRQIEECVSKSVLEQLYLPFKSKRISKGALAIAAGLEPLADKLWFNNELDQKLVARKYVNTAKGFNDAQAVLDGALAILSERLAGDTVLLHKLRKQLLNNALLISKVVKGSEQSGYKFKDYFDYQEPLKKIAAHRLLALLRGKSDGFLRLKLKPDSGNGNTSYCEILIAKHLGFSLNSLAADSWRAEVIKKAWKNKLAGLLETLLISSLKEKAYDSAIAVFSANLKDLLMAAPATGKVIMGLDPGFRTGCKLAVIDQTGKLLDHATIYPHAPHLKSAPAETLLLKLLKKYNVDLIAIGNGTASRETDDFIRNVLSQTTSTVSQLIVSEAGASVYSASQLACVEFPDLDVSIRGAVSIARRLQDPLAELVKIDAKAIGVGLYQHDLNQTLLSKRLQAVVEDCVNAVGVDVNSASVSLLSFIAGLNTNIAQNIVSYREQHGVFRSRQTLMKVPRLGAKAFQQCAGFLRITDGDDPLDNSAVHPEAYQLVARIAKQQNKNVKQLISHAELLNNIDIEALADEQFGILTVTEIINEIAKPQRDPRPLFKTVNFAEGINKLADLKADMQLQGVISNVTSFGAFVDIGVHQDGLIHISQLAEKFVADPLQLVRAGQIVEVKVLDVDLDRKRIALTMRL